MLSLFGNVIGRQSIARVMRLGYTNTIFKSRNATAGSVFGSNDVNHETWRAVKYLRGHDSDVQDLAWSKDNQYLASCGVDGFVIVWSGSTFGNL